MKTYKKHIYNLLRDQAPFTQFNKREKHPWMNVNFSKVVGFSNTGKITQNVSYVAEIFSDKK